MLPATPEILRFRSSPALVESLKLLLADPAMQQALKAVATAAQPRSIPAFLPGTPHDTTIAHSFCEMAGVNTALRLLESLTYTKDEKSPMEQEMEEEEFLHALPLSLQSRPNP